jgi:hypothetical protein
VTWSPIGSPSRLRPHGTEAVGRPARFDGIANGMNVVHRAGTSRPSIRAGGCATGNAGTAVAGVIMRS